MSSIKSSRVYYEGDRITADDMNKVQSVTDVMHSLLDRIEKLEKRILGLEVEEILLLDDKKDG